jgi:hypothetical protein
VGGNADCGWLARRARISLRFIQATVIDVGS